MGVSGKTKEGKGRGGRTDEVDEGDVRDDEGDDHVAGDAGDGHGEQPDHGQDRAQAEVVLVVQLENDEVQYVFSART